MRLIVYPAIDLMDGKCVRLYQGKPDAPVVYSDNPAEMAKKWESEGAEILHVVDLDGAFKGFSQNLKAVQEIASSVDIPIQLGGGLRDRESVKWAFDSGASRVVLGTVLINDPSSARRICVEFPDRVAAGIDARQGRIAIKGWGEETERDVLEVAGRLENMGVGWIIYTDIMVDGTRRGPNVAATKKLALQSKTPVIASGGVARLDDIRELAKLETIGVSGAIVGSALYEKCFTLPEAIKTAKSRDN